MAELRLTLSIPLFIIAGEIMTSIAMTDRLLNFSCFLVGRLHGHRKDFVAALSVSTAIQRPIIPPSTPFIIFSALTNTSVSHRWRSSSFSHSARAFPQPRPRPHAWSRLRHPDERLQGNLHARHHHRRHRLESLHRDEAAVAVAYALLVGALVYRNLSLEVLWDILDRATRYWRSRSGP
ncbi:MAG TPA: TRAP transporter large permease subunit [Aurantimonas coralicida]|uniref:TRAP transporter large permease subunit n=1 Tax=Aurantimonas coralicida TaxID=182270 RepID=A0A9C9NDP6_9HYPH|nr:TRAP transporter large permease subunit [Aurantimonas coralicida]HET99936.1 TRAP transporter large permease subunit [Aurantimonas coralicida]